MLTTSIACITPVLSIGALSFSGANSIDAAFAREVCSAVLFDEVFCDRARLTAGDDEPERCRRDASFDRRWKIMLSCDEGRRSHSGPMASYRRQSTP